MDGLEGVYMSDSRITKLQTLYCTVCGNREDTSNIGLIYGVHTCISCAEGMGEELKERGMQKPVKGTNERIVKLISHRLEVGQSKYRQDMQLTDGRDMIQESLEEILDACVYVATEILKLKDRVERYKANGALGKDY